LYKTNVVEKIKTHFVFNIFLSKIAPFMRYCGKIQKRRAGHRWQYALRAGHLGLQIHTQVV